MKLMVLGNVVRSLSRSQKARMTVVDRQADVVALAELEIEMAVVDHGRRVRGSVPALA